MVFLSVSGGHWHRGRQSGSGFNFYISWPDLVNVFVLQQQLKALLWDYDWSMLRAVHTAIPDRQSP